MLSGLFTWALLSVLVGVLAHNRGRFGFGWSIVSLMLSPLIGFIIVLCLSDAKKAKPTDGLGNVVSESTHRRCPACRELIRIDARKCRHCGEQLAA